MDAIPRHQQCVNSRCNVRSRSRIGGTAVSELNYYVHFRAGIFLILFLGYTIAVPTPNPPSGKQTESPISSLSSHVEHMKTQIFADHLPDSNRSRTYNATETRQKQQKQTSHTVSRYDELDSNNGSLSMDISPNTTKGLVVVSDNTTGIVPSDAKDDDKGPKVNFALLLLLGVLCILIFACIKCCNWFKSHVKEREYIEDGKLVFSVDSNGDLDTDSTETGYNPYETVTSSTYNPYSTVTSMISDISNVETRDASTSVKPRDIWKTMRSVRGLSVPDPEELEREGELLGNVVEEMKKLKNCLIKPGDSPVPSENNKIPLDLPPGVLSAIKYVDSSDEDLLEGRSKEPSVVVAEVEHHHSPSVQRPVLNGRKVELGEEETPLLESRSPNTEKMPHRKRTSRHHKKRSSVDISIQCVNTIEAAEEREPPDGRHRSISVPDSTRTVLDHSPGKIMRSRLRSPGRKRNISVSFEDEVVHIVDLFSKLEKKHEGSEQKNKRPISPRKILATGGMIFPIPSATAQNPNPSVGLLTPSATSANACPLIHEPNVSKGRDDNKLTEEDEETSSCESSSSSKVSSNDVSSSSGGLKTCPLSSDHTSDLRFNDMAKRGEILLPNFQQSLPSNLVSNGDICTIASADSRSLPPLSCH